MAYLGVLAGLMIGGIVLWGWYKLHRDLKQSGGSGPPASPKPRGGANPNALEEFIAAYRRGDVSVGNPDVTAASQTPAPPVAPAAPPSKRDPFLGPAVKLAYHLCKVTFKDHHVFAYVPLGALATNTSGEQALARSNVDLVVCNPSMSVMAAIDVIGPEARADDAAKSDYLRSLGIRYLRLAATSMPKPEELRALLYRM